MRRLELTRKHISSADRTLILRLFRLGHYTLDIARAMGLPEYAVYNCLAQAKWQLYHVHSD